MDQGRAHRTDRAKNLVGFVVGDLHCAVDILRVREIVNPLPMVVMPQAPPAVIGVADHRGEVLPVVDMRARLGLAAGDSTRKTKWIVARVGKRSLALVVDSVSDVFGAGEDAAREVPQLGTGDAARGFSAVYAHEGTLVFVVDVDKVAEATEVPSLPAPKAATR